VPAGPDEFRGEGEPPVVFTPGTMMRHPRQFFEWAVDACRRPGRRGLLPESGGLKGPLSNRRTPLLNRLTVPGVFANPSHAPARAAAGRGGRGADGRRK
jgi:hypothetical protein